MAMAVALGCAGGAQAANLVTNGSFETGDFTGWTTNEVSYPEYIVGSPVEDGVYSAQIAGYSYGPDTLSQVVTTTAAQAYTLSFWFWQDAGTPSGIDVSWDGVSIFSTTDIDTGGLFQQVTRTVTGLGSDSLVFSAYNDPAWTYVDNVSLTDGAVPEPGVWAMLLLGVGLVGACLRRTRRGMAASTTTA